MKKILLALLVMAIAGSACQAFAHPPEKINVYFTEPNSTASAVIVHSVRDPKEHYIKKVEIFLNDNLVATQEFKEQDNQVTQFSSAVVEGAKTGDIVSVRAYCSIEGDAANSITIE